ncbi:PIN domain-containing protein [Pseudomonas sp. BF-R-01]|uniref:PIN domain-containing protein n=1 Tax=Pseudomonas sp. BF-R-01 TaxID=2832365 RepID=UPI001CBB7D71|nr:PIN domain-containing protein [Pseudomonas sp. BF-R-01]
MQSICPSKVQSPESIFIRGIAPAKEGGSRRLQLAFTNGSYWPMRHSGGCRPITVGGDSHSKRILKAATELVSIQLNNVLPPLASITREIRGYASGFPFVQALAILSRVNEKSLGRVLMKVFLDTNVFYKNWFATNANLKLLFYFLNNLEYELLLSNIVIQEANNIRQREVNEVKSELCRIIKKGNQLSQKSLTLDIDNLGFKTYDLTNVLKERVDWIDRIEYDNVPHSIVVQRAISSTKPFTNEKKGYRDTLIWLSFLDYLSSRNIEGDVAFITNNKHDFFQLKDKTLSFHDDLLRDIAERNIKASIKPYLNVYDFVKENVDKTPHSFDQRKLLDDIEDFLVSETEYFLNAMNNDDLSELLETRLFSDKLTPILEVNSDIFEGLEHTQINSIKGLPGDSVYIESEFEMRRVDLVVSIDSTEYKQYADEVEAIRSLYNIEHEDNHVKLSFILRTYIGGSFEYDANNEAASNLSVDYIYNKQRRE